MNTANPKTISNDKYVEAVGRRKTSVARVRILPSAKTSYEINGKSLETYFPVSSIRSSVEESVTSAKLSSTHFKITVLVRGGGINSQAEAIRHGIARALVDYDHEMRGRLKKAGLLKRDQRAKERRKFGLKKARKSPQWSKR